MRSVENEERGKWGAWKMKTWIMGNVVNEERGK